MSIYKRICNFITKYRLVIYGLLTVLLIGACFSSAFVYIFAIVTPLVSLFLPFTHVLNLYIFIFPFKQLLHITTLEHASLFFYIVKLLLQGNLVLQHFILSIKNHTKCNWILLSLLAIFSIYLILPPHAFTLTSAVNELSSLALIYVIYQERDRVDFSSFTKVIAYSITISSLLVLLKPYAARLAALIPDATVENGYPRETMLYVYVAPLLALFCILRFYHKVDNSYFCLVNAIVLTFVIRNVTRGNLLATLLVFCIFSIMYLIKHKQNAFNSLLMFSIVLVVVMLFTLGPLTQTVYRVSNTTSFETGRNEQTIINEINNEPIKTEIRDNKEQELEQILRGEVYYDPGRIGLWKLYTKTIFSSPTTLLFGKGIGAPYIGQMMPHNIVLYMFYRYGLIGICFIIGIFIWCLRCSNFKFRDIRYYYPMLIFLIPTILAALIDSTPYMQNYNFWLFLIATCQFIHKQIHTKTQLDTTDTKQNND